MCVRKTICAACVAAATLLTTAQAGAAVLVDFEAASGYAAGPVALAGQPATGSPKWADVNNAYVVAPGVGVGGSQALQTGTWTASNPTASYKPALAEALDVGSSKLAYSFAIKELNAGQSAAHTLRVYLGGPSVGGSPAYIQFSTNAAGTTLSIKPNAGNEAITNALGNATPAFHTVAGVIDYAARTFTVSVDGTPAKTGINGTSSYAFVAGATSFSDYGSVYVQDRTAASSTIGSYVVDDLQFAAIVPEPATLAAAMSAGVALLGRRRR